LTGFRRVGEKNWRWKSTGYEDATFEPSRRRNLKRAAGVVVTVRRVIPDPIRDAVRAAFPAGAGPLEPLAGGRSGALVFGFEAEGTRWVARHSPYAGTERLRIASENGVAPPLRYVDVAAEVAIMEHFDGHPSSSMREPELRPRVADAVRRIHRGPAFPLRMTSAQFYAHLAGEYAKRTGEPLPSALLDLLATGAARSADSAPCHRDLNPGNVLVSRAKGGSTPRVCILDWDAAGHGDPYLDIAQLCVFYAPTPELRLAFLRDYLEREPADAEKTRLEHAHVYALATYSLAFAYMMSLSGRKLRAEPRPMPEVYAHLGARGHEADPDLVSASLLAEASRVSKALSYAG
jgi:aminoglycoside phosphotransferase (APT) family kinase protein